MKWLLRGIGKGIKTERSPVEVADWTTKLQPSSGEPAPQNRDLHCPTSALEDGWKAERCVFCRRCYPSYSPSGEYRLGKTIRAERTFRRSFYLYPIDVGTCGACNTEFKLLASPQYDMTRFGIFFTNTPRHADALVVMGVMTEGMQEAYRRAYDAMPEPKLVIALGTCALSGGIFSSDGIVADVAIPGCPPAPYTLLDALVKAKGGKGW
jgi:Ni,Fe-hydrogenase III small subunit